MHLLDTKLASTVVRLFPSQHWTPSRSSTPSSDLLDGVASSFGRKMELGNILNTKIPSTVLAGNSMTYDMQHTMQHDLSQAHNQTAYPPPYLNGRIKSETNSERGVSPHPSDNRYPTQPQQIPYTAMSNGYNDQMRYPSPSASQMGVPNQLLAYNPNAPTDQYAPQQPTTAQTNGRQPGESGPPKAFACSTCGKGFARRSDLARHGELKFLSISRDACRFWLIRV
jgi:hypothetical protein